MNLLRPQQVTEMLNISRTTLLRWLEQGQVEAITTPGGHHRYTEASVQKLLATPKDNTAAKADANGE